MPITDHKRFWLRMMNRALWLTLAVAGAKWIREHPGIEPSNAANAGWVLTKGAAKPFRLPLLRNVGNLAEALSDKWYTYEGHGEKPLLIHFWASWCHACEGEAPYLERLASDLRDEDMQTLAIASEDETSNVLSSSILKHFSFPLLSDGKGEVAAAWGVKALPQTLFVDKHGVIRLTTTGPLTENSMPSMAKAVKALLLESKNQL